MSDCELKGSRFIDDVNIANAICLVCREFSLKDLGSICRVSRLWNQAVQRELTNRGMQQLTLYEHLNNVPVLRQLNAQPHLVVLFTTHREFFEPDPTNPYPTVCYHFIKNHVNTTVLTGCTRLYTDKSFNTEYETYDPDTCLNSFDRQEIPCLFIPRHKNMSVKYVSLTKKQVEKKSSNHRTIMNKLIPKNSGLKTFVLIFSFGIPETFLKKSVNYLKERFEQGSYALWGSELFFSSRLSSSTNSISASDRTAFLGISISSAMMQVYSCVFYCEELTVGGFYQDLVDFKEKVKLNQHSVAFISGPWFENVAINSSDEDCSPKDCHKEDGEFYNKDYEKEYLYNFKKVFPGVTFIGAFHNSMFRTFGVDINGDDSNPYLMHEEAVTIVIVTFN